MNYIGDFLNNAKGLTKNPLGIIALFVSLIYGFACLVLSSSITNLVTPYERLPLVWFIILFPVIILSAFVFLVVNHHTKLYAPSDFRGDDSFIKVLDSKSIQEKQLNEVKILETAPIKEEVTSIKDDLKNVSEKNEYSTIEHSEIEKGNESAEILEPSKEDLIEIYKNTENWVVQELSLKYNVIFKANMSVSTEYGKIKLDAMGQNKDTIYILEIKYWEAKKSDKKLKIAIQNFLVQNESLEKAFKKNLDFKLVVALVFDSLKDINKPSYLSFVKNIYNDAHIEFFEYETLKKEYK